MLLALATAAPTKAEHTPDHRYIIVGTVTNDAGDTLCGIEVRAAVIGAPVASDQNRTATTDLFGRYRIQLHIHNGMGDAQPSEIGKGIRVTIDSLGLAQLTSATPNSGDSQGWGAKTIDFTAAGGVKSPGLCTREVALIASGGVGAVAVAFLTWRYVPRPHRSGRVHRELKAVPGVTRARARELKGAGVQSVKELAEVDPEELASSTNLTPKQARLLVKRAKESLNEPKA